MTHNPQNLLLKYISGNATDSEKSVVLEWIALSPENKQEFDKVNRIWEASPQSSFDPSIDDAWSKVSEQTNTQLKIAVVFRRPQAMRWISGIAASLLIAAVSYVLLVDNAEWTEVMTSERSVIDLPDGSKVWMKENSQLSYYFSADSRELKLDGEAYFEVQRIEDEPFSIAMADSRIEVLGTSFYARSSKDGNDQVTVTTGIVSFSDIDNDDKAVTLEAGEEAILEFSTNNLVRRAPEDLNVLSWQTGIFVFNKTPLLAVIRALTDYYEVDIEVENDALGNCLITSKFDNQPVEEVLGIIGKLLSAELIPTENGFLLKGEGC